MEGIGKVKDLIQELEESFRESNNMGNNLILRCVLLRAENQNLVHKIDEKKRKLSTTSYNKHWQFSVLSRDKTKAICRDFTGAGTKRIPCMTQSGINLRQPLLLKNADEIDILHKTIEDLQKNLRERDKKIDTLGQEYLNLKTSMNKMENDLKSKIMSLEKQLDLAYETLTEFQDEVEEITEKSLSSTKNTYEALFLEEKLRCSKLMYEKIRLNHEIKRLEDCVRRMSSKDENECWRVVKSSLDKTTSEPLMRHF